MNSYSIDLEDLEQLNPNDTIAADTLNWVKDSLRVEQMRAAM